MKIKPQELLRWVLAPLLAACLLAWAGMAYSDKVQATKPPAHTQISIPKAATSAEMQEAKKLLEELQAKERENSTLILEGQRKIADWWLSFLAIIAAIMAIAGAFIPFLMGRKDKEFIELERELIKQDRDKVTEDKSLVERDMALIKQMLDDAKATVVQIHKHEDDAKQLAEKMKAYHSGKPDGEAKEIQKAVSTVQNDPAASDALKLRAKAISASQAGQAEKAYTLWSALTELDNTDASAHFNAGYWAQNLGKESQGNESSRWLKQAGQHYSEALTLKPDMHDAANNWGNTLDAEAQAIAASDLESARTLWRQAGEKYLQALALKPDMHEAASNWGIALAAEARAVAPSDLESARTLWRQAGEKYLQALTIKPDMHEAANNWGVALAAEAQGVAASDLESARTLWRQAGDKYVQALAIKPDKHEAANNWGNALASEAEAIAATDLESARTLWRQAGEKYLQALTIKPDMHEAASNLGASLSNEANAMAPTDAVRARLLQEQAEQLLLKHAEAVPDVVAYNLACIYSLRGDVSNCLKWLKTSQAHKTLPDCGHLKKETDFEAVKNFPEFIEWLQTVCPPDNK